MPDDIIRLPSGAPMRRYQEYIHELETHHGWLDVDLVHNCFLMGEEVGELFKAVRKYEKLFPEQAAAPSAKPDAPPADERTQAVGLVAEEIVDVMNYLLAIANRLDIDLEEAFREKNRRNQSRTWK